MVELGHEIGGSEFGIHYPTLAVGFLDLLL